MHDAIVIRPERPDQPEVAFSEACESSRIVGAGDCTRVPGKAAGGAPCSETKLLDLEPGRRSRSGAARHAAFGGCPGNGLSVFSGTAL